MVQVLPRERLLAITDIVLAAVAGFILSFVVFFFAVLFPTDVLFRAQLLLEGPTPYLSMNAVMVNELFQAATIALGSFWWWAGVIVTSFFVSFWLLRSLRR